MTYLAGSQWELTAGIRYVQEDRTSGFSAISPNAVLAPIPLLPVVSTGGAILESSDSFDDFLPRFNALYRLNEGLNLYATVSKGRRSEVIDVTSGLDGSGNVVADVTEIPAEIIWNYEVGGKGTLLSKRLNYNASVFYQDYSDFQVTQQDDAGNFFTANAGAATNWGIEADVRALIGGDVELFANVAYIDAEIDKDSDNGNLAGNRFRLQPEWTASAGMFYSRAIVGPFNLTGSLVYSYRSDVFFEPDNVPIAGFDIAEDAYSLVNARIGIAQSEQGWGLSLFANNLLDKEYLVDAGNTGGSFGHPTFVAGPPLMWGLQFNYNFGQSN